MSTQPADRPRAEVPEPRVERSGSRATRIDDGRWLGGVCTGLAQHLHVSVLALRLAFVALAMVQFAGVGLYALLWLVLPPAAPPAEAPGLESHRRTGLRDARPSRGADIGAVVGGDVQRQGAARHRLDDVAHADVGGVGVEQSRHRAVTFSKSPESRCCGS